jgi:hypothetical protein
LLIQRHGRLTDWLNPVMFRRLLLRHANNDGNYVEFLIQHVTMMLMKEDDVPNIKNVNPGSANTQRCNCFMLFVPLSLHYAGRVSLTRCSK